MYISEPSMYVHSIIHRETNQQVQQLIYNLCYYICCLQEQSSRSQCFW